jgi:hypothetical protein
MEKLVELDRTEVQNINGGEGPTWKVTGRFIGAIVDFFEDLCNNYSTTPEGQAVQQALMDFH